MTPQCKKLLTDLRRKKSRGICATDYPPGWPIRSRMSDLKDMKYEFRTTPDRNTNLVRYHLISEPA